MLPASPDRMVRGDSPTGATTPAAESAVVLSRLRKEFPGTPPVVAVDDIELEIRDG